MPSGGNWLPAAQLTPAHPPHAREKNVSLGLGLDRAGTSWLDCSDSDGDTGLGSEKEMAVRACPTNHLSIDSQCQPSELPEAL